MWWQRRGRSTVGTIRPTSTSHEGIQPHEADAVHKLTEARANQRQMGTYYASALARYAAPIAADRPRGLSVANHRVWASSHPSEGVLPRGVVPQTSHPAHRSSRAAPRTRRVFAVSRAVQAARATRDAARSLPADHWERRRRPSPRASWTPRTTVHGQAYTSALSALLRPADCHRRWFDIHQYQGRRCGGCSRSRTPCERPTPLAHTTTPKSWGCCRCLMSIRHGILRIGSDGVFAQYLARTYRPPRVV
jgi:hypothetical protein